MKLFYGNIFPNVEIHPEEQQHILKVLRMKEGQNLFITDGNGNLASGTLSIEGKKALLNVENIQENLPKPSIKLHIAIAPTKNMDRIEFFVEKATELNISEITFLHSENSERKNINIEKIIKQSISASKQSLRTHFPIINDLEKFKDFIKKINPEKTFVAHCDARLERLPIQNLPESEEVTILIGPEGDFSNAEIQILSEMGIKAITLGNQRLRTETAGIFVASWVYSQMK